MILGGRTGLRCGSEPDTKRASEGARFLVPGPQRSQISVAAGTILVADALGDDSRLGIKSRCISQRAHFGRADGKIIILTRMATEEPNLRMKYSWIWRRRLT